jgi:hypothetical protein
LEDASIEIRTDDELLEWFGNYQENVTMHIDAQINEFDGTLQFSPTKGKKPNRKHTHVDEVAVGVDEEKYSDTESLAASFDSSFSDPEYELDDEIVEENDEDDISIFSFDVDDPCVDIGVVFPDVNQCKSALTQHATLNDYAFCTVKKDKKQFRAKCLRANKGCKWIFFASTNKKSPRCKVLIYNFSSMCKKYTTFFF